MENGDIFAEYLCSSIDGSIKRFTFPSYLKVAYVTLTYKKDIKEKYGPVSIVLALSKIFEKS